MTEKRNNIGTLKYILETNFEITEMIEKLERFGNFTPILKLDAHMGNKEYTVSIGRVKGKVDINVEKKHIRI